MSAVSRITVYLPLPWRGLIGPPRPSARVFPFDAARATYYYMARGAIWHGADLLGLKPGDEILMPAYNHGIEIQVLLAKGFRLRYYRVDERMRVDLDHLRGLLAPSTRAIYMTHYLGFAQPIAAARALAREAGVPLIEDCALALYARAPEGPLGTFGDVSVFCLYKNIPVPHGGMLVVNRDGLDEPPPTRPPDRLTTGAYVANRLIDGVMMNGHAWGPGAAAAARAFFRALKGGVRAETVPIDTNDLDTSVIDVGVRPVVRRIAERTDAARVIAARRENYLRLASALGDAARLVVPDLPEGASPMSLPILVPDKAATQARLLSVGIESVNMWSKQHPDIPSGRFPEVEFLRRHLLELPIHQGVRRRHVDYIAERARSLVRW